MPIDVVTLSTKGQLVLPKDLRESLSLNSGDKLVVYWSKGVAVLKKLKIPEASDFEKEIDATVSLAKETGMVEEDVKKTIKELGTEKKKDGNRD